MEGWQLRWRVLGIVGVGSVVTAIIAAFGTSLFILAFSTAILCFGIAPCLVPWRSPQSEEVEIHREELELKKTLVNRQLARLGEDWELKKLDAKAER